MKKSVNLYFTKNVDTKLKLRTIKLIGYDEFFTGINCSNETLNLVEQVKYAKTLGLNCTMIHCEYDESILHNFWLDNEIGETIFNDYLNQLKNCKNLTKNFVVHLNNSKDCPITKIGLTRINKLLNECKKIDVNLCIENLYSNKEIPYIFNNIKHEKLKICFDSGHRNFLTPNFDVLKEYGQYVSCLHLHDNDGIKDLHNYCLSGTINWNNFAKEMTNHKDLVLSSEIKYNENNYEKTLKMSYDALKIVDNKIEEFSKDFIE